MGRFLVMLVGVLVLFTWMAEINTSKKVEASASPSWVVTDAPKDVVEAAVCTCSTDPGAKCVCPAGECKCDPAQAVVEKPKVVTQYQVTAPAGYKCENGMCRYVGRPAAQPQYYSYYQAQNCGSCAPQSSARQSAPRARFQPFGGRFRRR
jgi:hypothetical protein